MKARPDNRTSVVFFRMAILTLCCWMVLGSSESRGEDRKMLIMKATMPRSFADDGGVPPVPLPSSADLNHTYFSEHNPNSVFSGDEDSDEFGSFAEYWKEISYGIVRIQGKVMGTAELPWPQFPVEGDEPLRREPGAAVDQDAIDDLIDTFSPKVTSEAYFDLNENEQFEYGRGERVREDRVLYETDFNNSADGGDLDPQAAIADNSPAAPSILSEDVDGDGHIDLGVEDIDGDGRFDVSNEDLNMNCILDFASEDFVCGNGDGEYTPADDCEGDDVDTPRWEDLDNDNNFDIGENPDDCPTAGFAWSVNPHVDWNLDGDFADTEDLDQDGRHDTTLEDANGNCIEEADNYPFCVNPGDGCCPDMYVYNINNPLYPPEGVWTPGERFRDLDNDEYYDRFFEPAVNYNTPDGDDDLKNNFSDRNTTLQDADDYADVNVPGGDDNRNFPEPLEDFMVRRVTNQPDVPQFAPVSQSYVVNNYPGNIVMMLSRTNNRRYDSPDYWIDVDQTNPDDTEDGTHPRKLEQDWDLPFVTTAITPAPSWIYDFWAARYGETSAQAMLDPQTGYGSSMGWTSGIPNLVEYDPPDDSVFDDIETAFCVYGGCIGGTDGWGTVLEQMIHLHPLNGVVGIAEFQDIDCLDVNDVPQSDQDQDGSPDVCEDAGTEVWGVVFDYDGSEFTYAYDTEFDGPTLDDPLEVLEQNDYLFGVFNNGKQGCIMPNGAAPYDGGEPMGTWGCDYDMNGDTEEVGMFGGSLPYVPSGFVCAAGSTQDMDESFEDEGCNDFLFDPCSWPGGNHPDCNGGNGAPGNGLADLPYPFSDPGAEFPPTNQTCLCIDLDLTIAGGSPSTNAQCNADTGEWIDPEVPQDPAPPQTPCFMPRCDTPYFPIPRYKPVPADATECQVAFAKRYGDGNLIPGDSQPENAGWPEGDDDDPILPPSTLVFDGQKEYDDLASSLYHTHWSVTGNIDAPMVDANGDGVPDTRMMLLDYGGDQMIGEVITSDSAEANREWYGHDRASFNSQGESHNSDGMISPAGPLAGGDTGLDCLVPDAPNPQNRQCAVGYNGVLNRVHGGPGFDGGNVLRLEFLTWRRDGIGISDPLNPDTYGEPLDLSGHTIPTPDGRGFRDFNLDGLLDLGEGRAHGTENYAVSSDPVSLNDGMEGPGDNYPFDRNRLIEDVVEQFDPTEDFDDWINDFQRCGGNSGGSADISEIVLLPEGLPDNTPFAVYSSSTTPINTIDEDDEKIATLENMLTPLIFNNLGASLDRNGESNEDVDSPGNFLVAFLAHEYGHRWECWPDLYDYDVFDGTLVEHPMARWDLMSGSSAGMVHVNPVFKENSGWIQSINLITKLIPGVPQEVRMEPIEAVGDSYYYYENPDPLLRVCSNPGNPLSGDCRVERFYFFHLHDHGEFSFLLPWDMDRGGGGSPLDAFDMSCPPAEDSGPFKDGGMMLLHADLAANSEAVPPQQRFDSHFSYLYVQADGQHNLEELFGAGGNTGDSGDPWPGFCNRTEWDNTTNPSNAWWRFNLDNENTSGLEILDVKNELSGSNVTMLWFPQSIPTLQFIQPPGGQSIQGSYDIIYRWDDLYGGTGLTLFVQRANPEDQLEVDHLGVCTNSCFEGTPVANTLNNPIDKSTPGNLVNTTEIDMDDFPGLDAQDNGMYRFYAFLDPAEYSPGADGGCENAATPGPDRDCGVEDYVGIAAFENQGEGELSVDIQRASPDDPNSVRLEGWQVRYIGANQWEVCGSVSGLQVPQGFPYVTCSEAENYNGPRHVLTTGQQDYETVNPDGAIRLALTQTGENFAVGDYFTFTTTGFTPYSMQIEVIEGVIDPGPTAVIFASSNQSPCCFPEVTVNFDGTDSTDSGGNPGGIIEWEWQFDEDGDGVLDDVFKQGPLTNFTYTAAGNYLVKLTVTEGPPTFRQGSSTTTIIVTNTAPVPNFTATPSAGSAPLVSTLDASGSFDPNGSVVQYRWKWDCVDSDCSAFDPEDPDLATANPIVSHQFAEGSYFVGLHVVDNDGRVSNAPAIHTVHSGNQPPNAVLDANPLEINAGETVIFDASGSTDPDGDDLTYDWNFGDGASVIEGGPSVIAHRYNSINPLGFTASVTVCDGQGGAGCSVASRTIVVKLGDGNVITASISASPTSGRSPLPVAFIASATDLQGEPLEYRWVFGDSANIGFGQEVSHTYVNPGSTALEFNPVLTVSDNSGAQGSDTIPITVMPADTDIEEDETITANFAVAAGSSASGVAPLFVQFDTTGSSAADGTPVTVQINFGDGSPVETTLPGIAVGHTYAEPDMYTATATVIASPTRIRQADPIEIEVLASEPPIAALTATPTSGSAPLEVRFDASASMDPEGQALSYMWNFGDNTPNGFTDSVNHTYNAPGEYDVILTVTDLTNGSDTATVQITVTSSTGGTGTPLPPAQGGTDGEPVEPGTCGGCGAMGAGQLLLMLLGLAGLRFGRRRRR